MFIAEKGISFFSLREFLPLKFFPFFRRQHPRVMHVAHHPLPYQAENAKHDEEGAPDPHGDFVHKRGAEL